MLPFSAGAWLTQNDPDPPLANFGSSGRCALTPAVPDVRISAGVLPELAGNRRIVDGPGSTQIGHARRRLIADQDWRALAMLLFAQIRNDRMNGIDGVMALPAHATPSCGSCCVPMLRSTGAPARRAITPPAASCAAESSGRVVKLVSHA